MLEREDKTWLGDLLGPGVRFDEPMAEHTSFKIGGPADAWAEPADREQLKRLILWAQKKKIPYWVAGGGTNLLVRDGGIRGLVIWLGRMAAAVTWDRQQQRIMVSAGAAATTRHVCSLALKNGWRGMNFALGIPGTVGGAVLMNAGTAAGCMADVLEALTLMTATGEIVCIQEDKLDFQYRQLRLPKAVMRDPAAPPVLLDARLRLTPADREQIRLEARSLMHARARRQPTWQPSAGCFFKNPSQDKPAGKLIDEAGLKGFQVGGARVSSRHANFVVNGGGASAADVLAVMAAIQEKVSARFGIALEPEVRIVGQEENGS